MRCWAEQTADRLMSSLSDSCLSTVGGDRAPTRDLLVAALEQLAAQLSYDMAYGLSHELNNPLANIAARARLLVEQETSEARRVMLSGIVDQAMRGCEMIADLMHLAKPPGLEIDVWCLHDIVDDICRQAAPWITARRLSLVFDAVAEPSAESKIEVDRPALEEALWSVLRNAIEAAHSRIEVCIDRSLGLRPGTRSLGLRPGDRSVNLRPGDRSVNLQPANRSLGLRPGVSQPENPHVAEPPTAEAATAIDTDSGSTGWMLTIRDDGLGLSEEALERAFYPYYSGREAGRGLGLGLCKARRIIELCGGQIELKNESGGCVKIWLPS